MINVFVHMFVCVCMYMCVYVNVCVCVCALILNKLAISKHSVEFFFFVVAQEDFQLLVVLWNN